MPRFSSHGKPFFKEAGIARWLKRDTVNHKIYFVNDTHLVEYDETKDAYTPITTLPTETGLEGGVGADHGDYLSGESFINVQNQGPSASAYGAGKLGGLAVENNRIYVLERNTPNIRILVFRTDGTFLEDESGTISTTFNRQVDNFTVDGNQAYFIGESVSSGTVSFTWVTLNLTTLTITSSVSLSFTSSTSGIYSCFRTTDRIYMLKRNTIHVFDHTGNRQTSEEFTIPTSLISGLGQDFRSISIVGNILYAANYRWVRAFTLAGAHVPERDFEHFDSAFAHSNGSNVLVEGGEIYNNRLYLVSRRVVNSAWVLDIRAFVIGDSIDFGKFVPYQFDTPDFDTFYVLSANNVRGNALATSSLDKVKVQEYVKSTDTWRELLNATTGQPQLSEPYKLNGEFTPLANNRKNFQVVRRNSKTLIFYRRVQAGSSGIAYYNVTDNTITDVYTENHSGNEDYGLPYSMDFALDERSDGIYVYTFVVRYTFESDGDYNGGTLKVYRRRVEPSGAQTEIYSETFTKSSDPEDYPVSVSSLILADDRSRFYFVLDYHGEGERTGKAELCTIAKAGGGSRTVIKSYPNPLVGARSPLHNEGRYYYLEGGWVRRGRDAVEADETPNPVDQHHYPTEGGRLIEIDSSDAIVDHGQVWRSATIEESPNRDDENYGGWGLHNSVVSNLIAGSPLVFTAGYGEPYRTDEGLPLASELAPVPLQENFALLQYGDEITTKIHSYSVDIPDVWDAITQLAALMDFEIGFGPAKSKVDAHQAASQGVTDWQANATLFFRPRTILPAQLRNAISASGVPPTILLNQIESTASRTEFPAPAAGESNLILIDRELFTYSGVSNDAQGTVLSGIARAQNGSVAAAHDAGQDAADVYFVDYFTSGEHGQTLVNIESRQPDFVNVYNDINISYGENIYNAKDTASVTAHGKRTLNLTGGKTLLTRNDFVWAKTIADGYLKRLKDLKERLRLRLVFSPDLKVGQLVVVHQESGLKIPYKPFRCVDVTHEIPAWQTAATVIEI